MNALLVVYRRRWWGVILCCAVSGCGLSDYEKRMDEQRKRIEGMDETNRLLEDPIESNWQFDVYLRLPKGFGTTVKGPVSPFYPWFVRYTNDDGSTIFVGAALSNDVKQAGKADRYTITQFRTLIKDLLKTYSTKYAGGDRPEFPEEISLPVKQVGTVSGVADSITYKETSALTYNVKLRQRAEFLVYFYEQGGKQIAIAAYHSLDGPQETFKKGLDACLGTLDISKDAGTRRDQFLAQKRR